MIAKPFKSYANQKFLELPFLGAFFMNDFLWDVACYHDYTPSFVDIDEESATNFAILGSNEVLDENEIGEKRDPQEREVVLAATSTNGTPTTIRLRELVHMQKQMRQQKEITVVLNIQADCIGCVVWDASVGKLHSETCFQHSSSATRTATATTAAATTATAPQSVNSVSAKQTKAPMMYTLAAVTNDTYPHVQSTRHIHTYTHVSTHKE